MDSLTKISTLEAYEEAKKGHAMMVFSTTWCPDCHFLKTFIDDLVKDNAEWTFYYIDRDEMIAVSYTHLQESLKLIWLQPFQMK